MELNLTVPEDQSQADLFAEQEPSDFGLADPGDSQIPLWVLINDLNERTLLSPPHQRDFIWDTGRQQAWIQRLTHGTSRAVGCIVTYQIKNSRRPATYINDGWQRLSTTCEYLASPEKFGSTKSEAIMVVKNYKVTVQHRHYASQQEALDDFQCLNLGTSLTPYEFYKGTLATMDDFKHVWEPLIERLHEGMMSQSRLTGSPNGRQKHKYLRHDYALWHYVLSGTRGLTDYPGIASADVKVGAAKHAIEVKLRDALMAAGRAQATDDLKRMLAAVRDDTALIEAEWSKVRPSEAELISNSVYRYLLHVGLWRRANSLPVGIWQAFLHTFLDRSKGLSAVASSDGAQRITVGMSRISDLGRLCHIIHSDLSAERPPRTKRPKNIRAGYDASHILPYSTHGNGPTIPEPASLNRSRGALPMFPDDAA